MKKKNRLAITIHPTKLSGEVYNYSLSDTGYTSVKKIHLLKQGTFYIFTIGDMLQKGHISFFVE